MQILGIGRNGHIGFNEPSESLSSNTHLTGLTQDTIEANARFFKDENQVPTHALTMGMAIQGKKDNFACKRTFKDECYKGIAF